MADKNKNTVLPTSAAESKEKLANNPATRAAFNQSTVNKASNSGTSADLAPKQVKKSWKDKVKDGWSKTKEAWSELTADDTPEVAAQRKEQREKERDVLKAKMAKQAEGLAYMGGALGTMLVPGLQGKAAIAMGAGALANAAAEEGKKANEKIEENNKKVAATGEDKIEKPVENTTNSIPATTAKVEPTKPQESYEAKIAKMNGLDKYIKEDGTVDYKKLHKSKIGFQILNALMAGLAGAGAGAAGKGAPDMSNSMLSQEINKRDEVVNKAKEKLDIEEKRKADKDFAKFASDLSTNSAKELMLTGNAEQLKQLKNENEYLMGLSDSQIEKLAKVHNPYGRYQMMMGWGQLGLGALGTIQGFIPGQKSDENCKKFAHRKVFK